MDYNNNDNQYNNTYNQSQQTNYNNQYGAYNQNTQGAYNQTQQPYYQQVVSPEMKQAENFAVASLVLGILSLIGIFPCGIAGIILGVSSKKKKPVNNSMATIGIVLSIISLSIVVLAILFWIIMAVAVMGAVGTL